MFKRHTATIRYLTDGESDIYGFYFCVKEDVSAYENLQFNKVNLFSGQSLNLIEVYNNY